MFLRASIWRLLGYDILYFVTKYQETASSQTCLHFWLSTQRYDTEVPILHNKSYENMKTHVSIL